MLKLNRKSTILLSFAGSILSLAALLIFMLLPTSDLANSVDHSAKDALMVFILSPVCAVLGSLSFIFALLKDRKAWVDFIECKPLAVAMTGLFGAFCIYNIALFASYLAQQFSLGFVAPFGGTVYEDLAVIAAVFVALKFLFSVLITIAVKRNK